MSENLGKISRAIQKYLGFHINSFGRGKRVSKIVKIVLRGGEDIDP